MDKNRADYRNISRPLSLKKLNSEKFARLDTNVMVVCISN